MSMSATEGRTARSTVAVDAVPVDAVAVDAVAVGADGSWQSRRAVEVATAEAARRHTGLLIVTVAQGRGAPSGLADLNRFEQDALAHATAVSQRARTFARAVDPQVPVETVVVPSLEAPELAGVVDRTALLVLGGHGRGGQVAFSIGSTSGGLARRFTRPMLLPRLDAADQGPRDGPARPAQVHIGLSGRGDESCLLHLAAVEAGLRHWALRVVHAVSAPHPGQCLRREQLETWRAVHSVPACSLVPCHVEVVQDDPVKALLAGCTPTDLLVVGTRGGGTLAGLVSGSVARGVLDRLRCDVLVVPPGARSPGGQPCWSESS